VAYCHVMASERRVIATRAASVSPAVGHIAAVASDIAGSGGSEGGSTSQWWEWGEGNKGSNGQWRGSGVMGVMKSILASGEAANAFHVTELNRAVEEGLIRRSRLLTMSLYVHYFVIFYIYIVKTYVYMLHKYCYMLYCHRFWFLITICVRMLHILMLSSQHLLLNHCEAKHIWSVHSIPQ
jgi:hypothetical protein